MVDVVKAGLVFDSMADGYDAEFTDSEIGKRQRAQVHAHLEQTLAKLPAQLEILELNCGTGRDAAWLAQKGHQVLATDASAAMVAAAKQKLAAMGGKAEVMQLAFEQVSRLQGRQFDLIFSDFGGLNCIDKQQMKHLLDEAAGLLKPGGRLVAVIMPRYCWWETGYFLVKLKVSKAFRRLRAAGEDFSSGGASIRIHYHSPAFVRKSGSAKYHFIRSKPVGLFIPPSYLEPVFASRKKLLNRLQKLDFRFGWGGFSSCADHYYIELERKKQP